MSLYRHCRYITSVYFYTSYDWIFFVVHLSNRMPFFFLSRFFILLETYELFFNLEVNYVEKKLEQKIERLLYTFILLICKLFFATKKIFVMFLFRWIAASSFLYRCC